MSRVFFREELEGVATFWRVLRRDGVALGFTTHDRDLWFDGVLHRSAPGLLPSSIRKTADFADDAVDVDGALSHDTISAEDLAAGRFDSAHILIGIVDWTTLARAVLYGGTIGAVRSDGNGFSAQLQSIKALLDEDPIPRTSPTCRARFCGPGCALSPARFEREVALQAVDFERNAVLFAGVDAALHAFGEVRWIDGPHLGQIMTLRPGSGGELVCDRALNSQLKPGTRAILRQGCDHRLETCAVRFNNAVNFQGEPFLPGNDLLAQYPVTR